MHLDKEDAVVDAMGISRYQKMQMGKLLWRKKDLC